MMLLIAPITTEAAAHPAALRFLSAVSFIQTLIGDSPGAPAKLESASGIGWPLADLNQCHADTSPARRARTANANTNDAHFIFMPSLDW